MNFKNNINQKSERERQTHRYELKRDRTSWPVAEQQIRIITLEQFSKAYIMTLIISG